MNTNISKLLLDKVINKIRANSTQRITFREYMELCLYDEEYGYYNSEKFNIGTQGDFFTSTSVSADFAQLLAIQLHQFWQLLGQPQCFQLVEMGAGEGYLAIHILLFLEQNYPHIIENLEYIIIEKSTSLKAKQQKLLSEKISSKIKVKWSILEELNDESIVGCFFSNELLDAMAIHLVTWRNKQLQEVYLSYENSHIQEIYDNLSTAKINDYFSKNGIKFSSVYPDNYRTEVNLQALNWLAKVAKKLQRGYLLTIDYGYTADKYYHPQRFQGTLKCYSSHRHHDNPYVNIGIQDITSHVNFTSLEQYGLDYGLDVIGIIPQAIFLMNLGLGDRLNQLSNANISLEEILSRRSQLHNLINPEGLGNFKVLLQTKKVPLKNENFPPQGFIKSP